MKRIAGLVMSWALVLFALAPTASAAQGVISVSPPSGPAGTAATLIVSGFVGGVPIEVHAGSKTGALLGSGTANSSGIAGIPITIPASAPPGPYVIYACGSCSSEIPSNQATTTYDVIPPTTTTEVTEPLPPPAGQTPPTEPTTTTKPPPPLPAPGEPCDIPEGAIHVDFDSWDRSWGETDDIPDPLEWAFYELGLMSYQWHHYTVTDPHGDVWVSGVEPVRSSSAHVVDNPANGLGTSSPPNALRMVGSGVYLIHTWSNWVVQALPQDGSLFPRTIWEPEGQLDYIGFNIGFGHFAEGFERPDQLEVELVVSAAPLVIDDGPIVMGALWEIPSVTLGPGPVPVTTCLMATNTTGPSDRWAIHHFEIRVRTPDGAFADVPVDIDDLFYGTYPPPLPVDGGSAPIPTTVPAALPPPDTGPAAPVPSSGSDWPVRMAFGIAGLILGAGSLFAFRKT